MTQSSDRPPFTTALAHHAADPFRLLVESVKEYAIFMLDPAGKVSSWNPGAERIKGYRSEEIIGQHFSVFYEPQDIEAGKPERLLQTALAEGRFEEEGIRVRKGGERYWAIVTVTVLHDYFGNPVGYADVTRDITERKLAEDAVRMERDLSASILNSLPGVYYLYDQSGCFLRWNRRFEEVTGYSAEEMVDRHPLDFFAGDDKRLLAERIAKVFRDGSAEVEAQFLARDGRLTPYYFNGVRAEIGEKPCLLGMGIDITARKEAEEALRATDARLRRAARAGNVGLWEWNIRTNEHYCSPEWKRQLGYEDDEIGNELIEWESRLHPDDFERTIQFVKDYISHPEGYYECEFRLRHKDGSYRWILSQASLANDAEGTPSLLLGSHVDITARKGVEQALHDTEARFRSLIEGVKDYAIYTMDAVGMITSWNEGATRIHGYAADEVLGKPRDVLYSEADVASGVPQREMEQAATQGKASEEGWRVHKNGTRFWANGTMTAFRDESGKLQGFVKVTRDLTEIRQAEEALRLRDRVIQAVSQGILILDPNQPDQPIIYASEGFERMSGYAAAEVLGKTWRLLLGKETDRESIANLDVAMQNGREHAVEIQIYRKNGGRFWSALFLTPVRDEEEHLAHLVVVLADVTDRRTLEQALHQSQKMDAIGQLAGGIAHDFNNLLIVISGYSELLLGDLPSDDPSRESLRQIQIAGERAASLTRQLLAFSRRSMLELKVVELNAIVNDMATMLRRIIGENVQLATALDPNLGRIKVDPGQLGQLLMNLAVNARDAMPKGGKLTIQTEEVEIDGVYAQLHPDAKAGRYVRLSVSDTGTGMPPEVVTRIFEPFFTTKSLGKGTGLGLAVVHGIVRQCGGHIEVYSEIGHGTTFKVYLPAVDQPNSTATSAPSRASLSGTETILLVEDEKAVRELAVTVLRTHGYAVVPAESAQDALRVLDGQSVRPDLVVTDIVMPGMEGTELVELLRTRFPGLPVLYLSGYTNDTIYRHGMLRGDMAYLQKPFTLVGLAEKIREVLDGKT